MSYLYIKALHIIFMVSWFAGLFYVVRLFIYHTEANERPENERSILHDQFVIMERKLLNIITTPAMILTVVTGATLIYLVPAWLQEPWMHLKLAFVVGLLGYHFSCIRISNRLKAGTSKVTSTQLRLYNELATVFLVAIVFLVILKSSFNWIYGFVGFFLFGLLLFSAVKIYKYLRAAK